MTSKPYVKIKEFLEHNNIELIPVCNEELGDANQYLSARSVGAFVITDSFASELNKKQPPKEYEDIRGRVQVLYDILIENDALHGEVVTNKDSRKIKSGDSILVDNVVLMNLPTKESSAILRGCLRYILHKAPTIIL